MSSAEWFEKLRQKWGEVPLATDDRGETKDFLNLKDEELVRLWENNLKADSTGLRFKARGWIYALYADILKGKRIIDIGSGFGYDAFTFSKVAHSVTCIDVVKENLDCLSKLSHLLGAKNVDFLHLKDISDLKKLANDYDVIWADGSLIHAPFAVAREEVQELLNHLKPEGRFIMLAYPKIRWEREGKLPFEEWGKKTDGKKTPYVEWYDLNKVKALLYPADADVILNFDFHCNDFNWFDLRVKKQEDWDSGTLSSKLHKLSLFEEEKESLVKSLQVDVRKKTVFSHFLGTHLAYKENGLVFTSTTYEDHLATPFLDISSTAGERKLHVQFSSAKGEFNRNVRIIVQYDNYDTAAQLSFEEGLSWIVPIPDGAKRIRSVIYSLEIGQVTLPEKLTLALLCNKET